MMCGAYIFVACSNSLHLGHALTLSTELFLAPTRGRTYYIYTPFA